jgi:hypothetical protein
MPPVPIKSGIYLEFSFKIGKEGTRCVAVAFDQERRPVARLLAGTEEEAERELKQQLRSLSNRFVGFEGGINLFLRAYPPGFRDPYFDHDERSYKLRAHAKAQDLLGEARLRTRLERADYAGIGEDAERVFTNLVFPNERMRFKDFVRRGGPPLRDFAIALADLLYGDEAAFDPAFDRIAALLRPSDAAKWPVITYWPFILHPGRHMLLKPEVATTCAAGLGLDFAYDSFPTAALYGGYLRLVRQIRDGIGELQPRDNIDVQTFMYTVGKLGFVALAVKGRAAWLAKQHA